MSLHSFRTHLRLALKSHSSTRPASSHRCLARFSILPRSPDRLSERDHCSFRAEERCRPGSVRLYTPGTVCWAEYLRGRLWADRGSHLTAERASGDPTPEYFSDTSPALRSSRPLRSIAPAARQPAGPAPRSAEASPRAGGVTWSGAPMLDPRNRVRRLLVATRSVS
jgi:hypothetical protein